ncbi:putative ring-cleavage extradiol dioxygenase [Rubrobacter radiotolerans]|uniref:Putative ring-cleavage extradiol dioxygenase n=1 Tax=Rubrobacter radiotolerans TaxID=42256 RepID=A0A023X0Z0_RUBRA|nr:VOC family protein [Rubrobacter radiotolerans]AHY45881.1 putative ring-cleavage extradiol dioxygenase [Rubrobacter radiotolerans]MDX5893294.1 VOC family protein [Rubrobacter radiotolerans]SMC03445.1 catechol 2,3-dioxygenase [Rubrobacter radiotolerans DSM 5868]
MSIHPETHVGRVELTVADIERALGFYRDILGFEVEREDGEARLSADGRELVVLRESPGAEPQPEGTTGLYHYAILLPDRPSLGRVLKRLTSSGYPLWGASDHLVSEALYLDDPDGNGIEIYRDRPRDEWRTTPDGSLQMATLRLDLRSVLDAGAGEEWSGPPPGTTIGHMHLHVGDLGKAEEFYSGVLGLDVTVRYAGAASFLSAGGYHHHLGVNVWAGQDAPPPPEGSAGLRRFELVLPDAAELDRVRERLDAAGVHYDREDGAINLKDPWGSGIALVVEGLEGGE